MGWLGFTQGYAFRRTHRTYSARVMAVTDTNCNTAVSTEICTAIDPNWAKVAASALAARKGMNMGEVLSGWVDK